MTFDKEGNISIKSNRLKIPIMGYGNIELSVSEILEINRDLSHTLGKRLTHQESTNLFCYVLRLKKKLTE